jgi:hypothetical protein
MGGYDYRCCYQHTLSAMTPEAELPDAESERLRELVRRLEGGERSRQLEIEIYCATHEKPAVVTVWLEAATLAPPYFESLDAARTLVPAGEDYSLGVRKRAPPAWAVMDYAGRAPTRWADRPEIALTLAALYARIAAP